MNRAWTGLLDLLVPRRCAACDGPLPEAPPRSHVEKVLCDACAARLDRLPGPAAGVCRLCQRDARDSPWPQSDRCPACARTPSPLACCVAEVSYRGVVEHWIRAFKYAGAGLASLDPGPPAIARSLARDAAERMAETGADWIVPIPLHARRLRERGFNPATTLARAVAPIAGARVSPRTLVRTRDTPSQTGLDRLGRSRNVAGAFGIGTPARIPPTVWLVDDVVTTGSTLEEAARTLRRAGARRVVALCVARTPFASPD